MSRILCPECGTKISDKATKCPHCGFQSADPKRPISEQDKYEMVPIFEYDIEEWQPNCGELSIISYEDNRSLIQYFGKWENIKVKLPAIAEVIGAMAGKDHIMVAKMDSYVKDLIDKGIYRFTIDKQGEILPTIRYCKKCGCELVSTNKHKLCDNCRRERNANIRNGVLGAVGTVGSIALFIVIKRKHGGGGNKA